MSCTSPLGEPREAVREENGREQTDSAQSPGVAGTVLYNPNFCLTTFCETKLVLIKHREPFVKKARFLSGLCARKQPRGKIFTSINFTIRLKSEKTGMQRLYIFAFTVLNWNL